MANREIVTFGGYFEAFIGDLPERTRFKEEAYSFYFGQALRDTRKEANVTQLELARRVGTSKSYISKVEHGNILPSIGAYCRLLNALGRDLEIVRVS